MAMTKIYPHMPSSIPNIPSNYCLEEKEKYTVWMRSLVLNGNGCTIFDSNGKIVYRIDNYDTKHSHHVCLMDLKGKVLCTLLRKKLSIYEHWNGFKCERVKGERPWFRVKKISKVFNKKKRLSSRVTMGGDEGSQSFSCFRVNGSFQKKSELQIIRNDGIVAAQVKRKETSKGVMLGDDVLSLEIGAQMDRSLIMALVVVHALMSHKI